MTKATLFAKKNNFHFRSITTNEIEDPLYQNNSKERCYHCRRHMYGALKALAKKEHYQWILNGEHKDDCPSKRPGMTAAKEFNIRSVLKECGFDKIQVRQLALSLDLDTHDLPADACLASRLPTGIFITLERLKRVEAAEDHLHKNGFRPVRVRSHGIHEHKAIIEVPQKLMQQARNQYKSICKKFILLGFHQIQLSTKPLRR